MTAFDSLDGVIVRALNPNRDDRGSFTEVFRADWGMENAPRQWSLDHSNPRTLRGMHVHRWRWDYVTMAWGSMLLALHDLREDSRTFGRTVTGMVHHSDGVAVRLPPGVMHGFYYAEEAVALLGFSVPWTPQDDVRCHHAAPELGIAWPGPVEHISDADRDGPGYEECRRLLLTPAPAAPSPDR